MTGVLDKVGEGATATKSTAAFEDIAAVMSDPVSQLYILVMCISQAGPEGYWVTTPRPIHSAGVPAFTIGTTTTSRLPGTHHNQVAQL